MRKVTKSVGDQMGGAELQIMIELTKSKIIHNRDYNLTFLI